MRAEPRPFRERRVAIVGLGGLGCPVALALARAGVGELVLVDDDVVDRSNLHRQILYSEPDVGRDKLDAASRELGRRSAARIELVRSRFLPDNARAIARDVDLIVEGADNFATKFLAADAARIEARPVIHGAAIRWVGTAWAVAAEGSPCYRCLFEDVPTGAQQGCDDAGVVGPLTGFIGALMAELALEVLSGSTTAFGRICQYDARSDRLRASAVPARVDCPLCGPRARFTDTPESRYTAPRCAA